MANLKEDNTWEQGIYQFETSDPVMGGPNGIDNVPTSQLANRTLWLKNQLAAAVQSIGANKSAADAAFALKATTLTAGSGLTGGGTLGGNRVLSMGKPSKITATSTDEAVSDTHSHSIDKASTSVAGIVMLVNALNSTATDCALTAAQGKALADMVSNAATAVKNEILGGAGAAFDTLKELAAALGNDANFARTIADELAKKADKATTLAAYGLGDAIAVLTGTIADGGTIPLPAGFSEAQCKFMVSTSRDNPEDIPWDIDESGRHVHYSYECTLNGRVVSCKAWLNKNRTTMGNAHPEITVPGRANYLVIAYK
mgnify:FL=1